MASVEIEGIKLTGVHEDTQCQGRTCIIHSPTDHHMRGFPLHWRGDRGIFERICEHGIGHPDPDQFAYWNEVGAGRDDGMGVHGCDGCCQPPPVWTLPPITLTHYGTDIRAEAILGETRAGYTYQIPPLQWEHLGHKPDFIHAMRRDALFTFIDMLIKEGRL